MCSRPIERSCGKHSPTSDVHFVCPWHGYEYHLTTGECVGDRRLKLRSYQVVERNGEVFVLAELTHRPH